MTETLQFAEITSYPTHYNIGSIIARMLDGAGFRYYWATEGLTAEQLMQEPGNGSRSLYQIMDHIYNMVDFLGNSLEGTTTNFPEQANGLPFEELRQKTLARIEAVKMACTKMDEQTLEQQKIQLTVNGHAMQFDNWHLFNGPLPDIYHHIGQLMLVRRILGNPIPAGVEPFMCKRMEA